MSFVPSVTLDKAENWSPSTILDLHQRACRAIDTFNGLDKVLEELRWTESQLRRNQSPEPQLLATTRVLIGTCIARLGNYQDARPWLEKALKQIPGKDANLRGRALNAYAIVLKNLGEVGEAYRIFDDLDRVARETGTPQELIRILTNKANLLHEAGDSGAALPLRKEAVDLARLVQDGSLRARLWVNQGFDQIAVGDDVGAEYSLYEAHKQLVGTEDTLSQALVLMLEGSVAFRRERIREALNTFNLGLNLIADAPFGIVAARLSLYAAEAHNRLGEYSRAAPLAESAHRSFEQSSQVRLWLESLLEWARSSLGMGDMELATRQSLEARQVAERSGQLELAMQAARLQADVAERDQDLASTIAFLREASFLQEKWFSQRTASQLDLLKVRTHIDIQDESTAVGKIREADLCDLNEELRKKNVQLERLHHEKRELLTVIAHDLRNHLGTTVNYAELALFSEKTSLEVLRDHMQTIFSITRSTQELLEHLLSLERIESGEVPVRKSALNLCQWVSVQIQRIGSVGKVKGTVTESIVPEHPVYLETDETWVRLALDNLLSNAYKYAPPGSVVTVRVEEYPDRVRLLVEDQGPGIAEEDRKHLFTKFHRTRNQPTGSEFSTGLGLYLVKRYADFTGCEVGFEPRSPKGSIFFLAFPRPESALDE